MKPIELASYAYITPSMYAWYFYSDLQDILDSGSAVMSSPNKEKTIEKFWKKLYEAVFGGVTRMLDFSLISGTDYLAFVDKLYDLPYKDLIECYKVITAVLLIGNEENASNARENLMGAFKETCNKKSYKLLKKAVKGASDEEVLDYINQLKTDAAKAFIGENIDKGKEYRYKKPNNCDFVMDKLNGDVGKVALSIIDVPAVPKDFYENLAYYRHERIKELTDMCAPEIILSNEWRMFNEDKLYAVLAIKVLKKEIDKNYVVKALKAFYSEEYYGYRTNKSDDAIDTFLGCLSKEESA